MTRRVLLALAVVLVALPASAKRSDHPARLIELLSGIDTVPTAQQLRQLTDEPQVALLRVALDRDLHTYVRKRATSLLSAFPDEISEAYLTLIAATQDAERLRWIAVYTYGRFWAPIAPKRVLAFLDVTLHSPRAADRDAAVRALRWLPGEAADRLLERTEAIEKDPTVQSSIARVLKKRAQR